MPCAEPAALLHPARGGDKLRLDRLCAQEAEDRRQFGGLQPEHRDKPLKGRWAGIYQIGRIPFHVVGAAWRGKCP